MSTWENLDARTRVHRVVRSAQRRAGWWTVGLPLMMVLVITETGLWRLVDPEPKGDMWSLLRGAAIGVSAVGIATLIQNFSWRRYITKLGEAPFDEIDVVAWWLWLEYPEYGSEKSKLASKKSGLLGAVLKRDSLLPALAKCAFGYNPPGAAIANSNVLHVYDVAASVSGAYVGLLAPLKSVQHYIHKGEGWEALSRGYARVAGLIERYRDDPVLLALAAKFCETESARDPYGSEIDIEERYDRVEKTLERVRRSG